MTEAEILRDLNQEQKEAVTHQAGPLLIVAGAGTGKTTVITRRLAWLILSKKAKPEEILALTFTDKAAEEMEERVDCLLPYGYVDLWVSTFHSFGERILKDNALEIGLDPNFKLLTPVDAWQMIRQNLAQFELEYYRPLGSPTRFLQALVQHFSRLKDENVQPEEYLQLAEKKIKEAKNEEEKEMAEKILEVANAYRVYEEIKREKGQLDFGDLIVKTLELFQKRPSILEKYRRQFKYILVDEFQDTNWAQYELLKLLASPKNNLTVTGDDDQSLYRWRGAAYTNLIQFTRDYPEAKIVVLKENYRNKQNILDLAYQFIQLNNPDRLEYQLAQQPVKGIILTKRLKTVRQGFGLINHLHFKTQEEEASAVIKKIIELKKENRQLLWSDFAILVRANAYADLFIQKLSQLEIPYQFVASRGLYRQPEIMDLISFLRLLDNYHESSALYRIVSLPIFRFDPLDLMNLMHYARRKNISLFETFERSNLLGIKPETRKEIDKILELIRKFTILVRNKTVGQILYQFVEESGLLKIWSKEETSEDIERISHLRQFFKKIEEFERTNEDRSIKAFIDQINLEIEAGEEGALRGLIEEGPESVKVMTIHQAKGLEFPYVFIVNLVDKRFPSIERKEPIEVPIELIKEIIPEGDYHLQEERRIFYVAMTRARDGLFFTSAEDYGGTRKKRPSRFLQELGFVKEEKVISREQQKLKLTIPTIDQDLIQTRKNIEVLPKKFSYTQLHVFELCPKQYKYAHILQIPGRPKFTFSFGHSIHNTLRDFYLRYQETKKVPTLEELLAIYEKNWLDEWYESKEQELERKEKGRQSLIEFYKKHQGKFKIPKFIEKKFNIKIGNYTLKGVIDRIDILESCQMDVASCHKVEIIDYKTGEIPKNERLEDLDQLLIYALAVREVFYDIPAKLTYYYFDSNQTVTIENFENELSSFKERVKEKIEEILKSDFSATPNPWKCRNCDFREICEDRQL
ncbi:MAG: UvrD-helicase domain-containing protein [Patescibacteria group bacterium]|nr:UvrD-helicase domain-containing protein [Patescibacteria group bacterium]